MKTPFLLGFLVLILSFTLAACKETQRDISFTTRDAAVTVPVLANDRFKTSQAPTVVSASVPAHGATTVQADNTVRYIPSTGFVGVDRFTYDVVTNEDESFTENVVVTVRPPYHHHGCNFSPYIDGQNPRFGGTVTPEQLAERIEFIAPYCEWIRFFGLADDLLDGPRLAKDLGMKVAAGAWLDFINEADDQEQVDRLISVSPYADVLVVGNEVLLRRRINVPFANTRLLGYIEQVKTAVPGKPVTTAEEDGVLRQFPDVIAAVDVVYANIHPWWDSTSVAVSMFQLYRNYLEVKTMAGSKEVVISEAGWKSFGDPRGNAIASVANQVFYHTNLATFVRATGIKTFVFSAFDEPWKSSTDDGWGIWDMFLQMKAGMEDVFEGASTISNWGGEPIGGPGSPTLQFTQVPPYGQRENAVLHGQVTHIAPNPHWVVVYINVGQSGGTQSWWVKPTAGYPHTRPIEIDGSFTAIVANAGIDEFATQIAAFVVPRDYIPPVLLNATSIPPELYANSVAHLVVNR